MNDGVVENKIFFVNDEPYCIWEIDINERNIEFLRSIDSGYFDYVLRLHIESEDEKRAALGLRIAYHHALETLFSFLGAHVQAPECVYAWVNKCSNSQLRKVVGRIYA